MRILMSHNYYLEPGGESTVFDNESQVLESRGHNILRFVKHNDAFVSVGSARRAWMATQMVYSHSVYRQVRELVSNTRPDVSLIQNVYPLISPAIYYALKDARIPVIQLVHQHRFVCVNAQLYTGGEICTRCTHGNFFHSVPRRCYRDSTVQTAGFAATLWVHHLIGTFRNRIDAFIVPDQYARALLIGIGINADRIFVNTNPYKAPANWPEGCTGDYALFVGRFVPQKGVLTLIRAMQFVKSAARVKIVGGGELESAMRQEISALQLHDRINISPPAWGHEMQQIMANARFVIVPSEWYDCGMHVPYQAYGLGRPVIGSRVHGLVELIDEDITGLLFDMGDAESLAEAIDRLWTDDAMRERMSAQAREKAVRVLDAAPHYDQLMSVIDFASGLA